MDSGSSPKSSGSLRCLEYQYCRRRSDWIFGLFLPRSLGRPNTHKARRMTRERRNFPSRVILTVTHSLDRRAMRIVSEVAREGRIFNLFIIFRTSTDAKFQTSNYNLRSMMMRKAIRTTRRTYRMNQQTDTTSVRLCNLRENMDD